MSYPTYSEYLMSCANDKSRTVDQRTMALTLAIEAAKHEERERLAVAAAKAESHD